jgi:alkanesulfonate monooxygenase SsuD/methylene tetrahydromethanopterin reductase-like flavin-dependent oxidoreductase (luciferase family)
MQVGVQFHLPTYKDHPIPELVSLGKTAKAAGVSQLWVTDNLQSRNAFVVLAAMASNIPINLGTAVTVQYFRNPVDLADSVASISEIMDGEEFSVGLARGNGNTPNLINSPKPITMLRQTAECLKRLLNGETVSFGEYPALASYFNINPGHQFVLNFKPKTPIRLYCGGNGPLSLAVGGETMDGLIYGGEFKAVAGAGRLPEALQTFKYAAEKAGKGNRQPKIAEIKLSVSKDESAALEFARHTSGRRLLNLRRRGGYGPEEFHRLGVEPGDLERLDIADREGVSSEQFGRLVTEQMIDAVFVAGGPDFCRERMIEVNKTAQDHGFQQLMFSELGPNVQESMKLLCDEVIPAL